MKAILFLSFVFCGFAARANNADTTAPITVRLHCVSTLPSSNQPLYVINGKPVDDSLAAHLMNTLEVKLIEKIEIFKDAKATALYGSRAFYGVIAITTKQTDFVPKNNFCKPKEYENDHYIL